ncbi:MAG: transposase [Oligoflexia bacterium]|nr:transposase [Oligoflexia bacterium]
MKVSRKRYSEEFKKEAIMRVMSQGSSSYKVSKELGVGQPTLCKWVKQFKQEGYYHNIRPVFINSPS